MTENLMQLNIHSTASRTSLVFCWFNSSVLVLQLLVPLCPLNAEVDALTVASACTFISLQDHHLNQQLASAHDHSRRENNFKFRAR